MQDPRVSAVPFFIAGKSPGFPLNAILVYIHVRSQSRSVPKNPATASAAAPCTFVPIALPFCPAACAPIGEMLLLASAAGSLAVTYTRCVLVDRLIEVDDVGVPSTTFTTTLDSVTIPTDATEAESSTPSDVISEGVDDVEVLVGVVDVGIVVVGVDEVEAELEELDWEYALSSLDAEEAEEELARVAFGFSLSLPPFVTAVGGAKSDVVETVVVKGAR